MKLFVLNRDDQQMCGESVGVIKPASNSSLNGWSESSSQHFCKHRSGEKVFAGWCFLHGFELWRWKEAAQCNLTEKLLQLEFWLPGWLDLEFSFMSTNLSVYWIHTSATLLLQEFLYMIDHSWASSTQLNCLEPSDVDHPFCEILLAIWYCPHSSKEETMTERNITPPLTAFITADLSLLFLLIFSQLLALVDMNTEPRLQLKEILSLS